MNHRHKATLLPVPALAVLVVLLMVALAACGTSATNTTTPLPATTTTAVATSTSGPGGAAPIKIEVPLSGDNSVPPVNTQASGTALITLEASPNGYNISFELNVTNIVDVTAAHIHLGAADANGEVIVPLFTGPTKSGSFTGLLAKGTITEADLTGPMKGKTFAELAAAVIGGQTYVNVHTVANPKGEIRGQIIVQGAVGGATATTAAGGAPGTSAGAVTSTTAVGGY